MRILLSNTSRFRSALLVALLPAVFTGCFFSSGPREVTEYYHPTLRQAPAADVYGRLTLAYLPEPVPSAARKKNVPYLSPVMDFDLPDATLAEALEAVGQTIGYRVEYDPALGSRPVSVTREATLDVILTEIGRQANVNVELLHTQRRLVASAVTPAPALTVPEVAQ